MNIFLFRQIPFLLLGLIFSLSLVAQPVDNPGSLDFDSIPQIAGVEPNVEVNLYGPILKMVAQLPVQHAGGDENAAELLRAIDQVLVRVYESIPDDSENILSQLAELSGDLERQNWMRVVRVRDGADHVDILLKMAADGENINGIVVLALDGQGEDSELVFVNISGNFNPAYLADLGNQFDIESLGGVELP